MNPLAQNNMVEVASKDQFTEIKNALDSYYGS